MKIGFLNLKQMKGVLRESAENFIFNSMQKSVQENTEFAKMDKKTFHEQFNLWLEELLKTANVIVCTGEDPKHFHGYLIYKVSGDTATVFFIYVKHLDRRQGLANYMYERFLSDYGKLRFCFKTRSFWKWRANHQDLPFKLYYSDLLE